MLVAVGAGAIAAFGLIYTHRNHQLGRQQQPRRTNGRDLQPPTPLP
jgi:hypothetical protein